MAKDALRSSLRGRRHLGLRRAVLDQAVEVRARPPQPPPPRPGGRGGGGGGGGRRQGRRLIHPLCATRSACCARTYCSWISECMTAPFGGRTPGAPVELSYRTCPSDRGRGRSG